LGRAFTGGRRRARGRAGRTRGRAGRCPRRMMSKHVEAAGAGPPLVLLHGWALHSGIWGELPATLARRYRVHAVDLPGHGYSPAIAPLTADAVVRALDRALASEREPLTVLGWALGGPLALASRIGDPA